MSGPGAEKYLLWGADLEVSGAAIGVRVRGQARAGHAPDLILRIIVVTRIGARKCSRKKAVFWPAGTGQVIGRESLVFYHPGAWSGTFRSTASYSGAAPDIFIVSSWRMQEMFEPQREE